MQTQAAVSFKALLVWVLTHVVSVLAWCVVFYLLCARRTTARVQSFVPAVAGARPYMGSKNTILQPQATHTHHAPTRPTSSRSRALRCPRTARTAGSRSRRRRLHTRTRTPTPTRTTSHPVAARGSSSAASSGRWGLVQAAVAFRLVAAVASALEAMRQTAHVSHGKLSMHGMHTAIHMHPLQSALPRLVMRSPSYTQPSSYCHSPPMRPHLYVHVRSYVER